MKTLLRSLYTKIFLFCIALYTLLGFVIIPYVIQSNFTKIISQQLNTQGYLKSIYFNPFTFELKLNNLLIQDDKNNSLLYFKSLYLNIDFTNILSKEIIVDALLIDELKTSISLYEENKFNFSHILAHLEQLASQKEPTPPKDEQINDTPLSFTLNQFLLTNTRIIVNDLSKQEPFELKTKPFDFEITDFSTKKDTQATLMTNIEIENILMLRLNSSLQLSPLELQGDIAVQNIQLAPIYSYLKNDIDFVFDGVIENIATNFTITMQEEKTQADLNTIELTLPKITYNNKDVALTVTQFENTIKSLKVIQTQALSYTLNSIQATVKTIDFVDKKKDDATHFVLQNIAADIDTFGSDPKTISNISFGLHTPKSGILKTTTKAMLNPLNIESVISLQDFTISPYKEYIKDFVNLDIKETIINTNTTLKLTQDTQDVVSTVTLSDINIFHSLTNKQLLEVQTLAISDLKYTNNNLLIENILIDNFATAVKIAPDKTTNVDNITHEKDTAEEEPTTPKEPFHYHIKKLQLTHGKAAFSDHSLPLNFDTNIHSLQAQIDDLSSKNEETDIRLSGVVEKYGLANIQAKTLLSNFKEKTDVSVKFENLDVRSYSPYSGKFIGQKIADGKLWLTLNYNIQNAQLQSTNNIKIKNLTLGEDVQSPDALSLPVGLAIALLEDSDGLIDLDVPIKGDMDNPQFELGGVIWKTIGNIITNAVTAPFRFLGSLLGIKDDTLGEVNFRYGSFEILAPQKEKLDQLIKLLQEKKNLTIQINKSFHTLYDTNALLDEKFYNMTKSKDKNKTIKELYTKQFGEKALQAVEKNFQEQPLIEELSKELKNTIVISKEELTTLANKRATQLKEYFLTHKLTLDRIQITEKVFEDDDIDAQEVTLKLELNIKE